MDDLHGLLFTFDPVTKEITFVEEGTEINISDFTDFKEENLDIFLAIFNNQYADVFDKESTIKFELPSRLSRQQGNKQLLFP